MNAAKHRMGEDSPLGEWLASLLVVASWGTLVLVSALLHG
jgi:hypothetical protein